MGNHTIARVIGPQAEHAVTTRRPGESALAILDRLCQPWRDTDAEWSAVDPSNPSRVHPDYPEITSPHPHASLGMLMVEAFAPNGLADLPRYAPMLSTDATREARFEADEAWWNEVGEPFKKRYEFW